MRRLLLSLALILFAPLTASAAEYSESPALAGLVAAGKLPPVAERLPQNPYVVAMDGGRQAGRCRNPCRPTSRP